MKPIGSQTESLEMIFRDLPVGAILEAAVKLMSNRMEQFPERAQVGEAQIRILAAIETAPAECAGAAAEQVCLACITKVGLAIFGME